MTPKVANIDPGVNNFHLLFIAGPKWKSIDIAKKSKSKMISHFPNKIISASKLVKIFIFIK